MTWPMLETLGLGVAVLFLFYYYFTSTFDFWKKRGVKGPKPIPYLGNFKDVFLGKASISDCLNKAYYDYKDEPMVGIFAGQKPLLVLRDPELMKDVLIKDFSVFADRTFKPVEEIEPLSAHLFRLDSARWKPLRTKLSPIFSSGKLKEMFYLLLECSNHFEKYLHDLVAISDVIECREVAARYTTDVIGSCAFGIEMNALTGESEFRKVGRKVFATSWITVIRDRLREEYPLLYKMFGRVLNDYEISDFLTKITRESIDYRIKNNIHRHDFIDTLVDLKQHPEKLGCEELTEQFLTAQAFVFFVAGFETSSVTITNILYEFALNPLIQERAREDIKNVLQTTDGVITYDSLKEMKYLDACFKETLRKYPVLLFLSRLALADYTFQKLKVNIPKNQEIFLPVYAIQHDPDIYPEPDVFDPERFIDERNKHRHAMHFLPFGDGPRNCIGARFATIQAKVAVIKILSNYKVNVCEKTKIPYIMDMKALFLLQPAHGVYVSLTKLEE
ncbi:putative cytochrome P450 6a14 [Ptiloglossa arizonensis]|uniref:putative cytochrome P450 6a14 n=1 Tax=Ptiloglossa arizonensis TaxID=3350558 RepID=UPI003F9F8013